MAPSRRRTRSATSTFAWATAVMNKVFLAIDEATRTEFKVFVLNKTGAHALEELRKRYFVSWEAHCSKDEFGASPYDPGCGPFIFEEP